MVYLEIVMHPWFGDGKQIYLVYFKIFFSKDVFWFTPGYLSIQPDAKDDILPNYKLKLFLANYSKRNINKALKQLKNQFYGNLLRT